MSKKLHLVRVRTLNPIHWQNRRASQFLFVRAATTNKKAPTVNGSKGREQVATQRTLEEWMKNGVR
ncbi:MAG: hypothetical protein A4C66_04410 [Nitrospira sp. HN-bin3]|nr:MAG: hypothetical protein A4C66_04410 [Nitrospira sp. HN-bin3]